MPQHNHARSVGRSCRLVASAIHVYYFTDHQPHGIPQQNQSCCVGKRGEWAGGVVCMRDMIFLAERAANRYKTSAVLLEIGEQSWHRT